MAASPETAEPPESSYTHPPSSPGLHPTQESPSLTTAAPPAMANPDYATQVPLPHAEQSTVERPEADEAPPTPIDEAEPSSSDPPPEAAPAASSAFEAIPTEKLTSPSPLPEGVAAEVSPEVAASAPSPSPSPQIVGPSPEDALPLLSPPRAPPSTTAHISTDPSTTESIAMASQEEAARPSPAPKLMDADSRTAPPPLTPTMESGLEGLLPQQQTRSPSPEMALTLYENLKRARPTPTQSCHPAECTDASPDAMLEGVVEGTLQVAGSLPVVEATDGDMAITPGVLPALENGSEGMLSQQQLQPPCPEIAPLQGENSKSAHPPRPPLPVESTYDCSNAALNEVSAVASEGASAALEYVAERSLQEPVQTPSTSRMEAEPCSPEMAPPGFEDFKSQWLPLSPLAPPAESTYNVVQVSATNPVGMMPDAATKSLSAIEAMDVKMDISPGLLPPLKSGAEGQSQQPLLRSCSPMMEDAPCSPDMPPPGFENCKSSSLPPSTLPPLAETTESLADVASTKAVVFVEKACPELALDATDVEMDTERCRLLRLESGSGTGCSSQGLPSRSPPTMQAAPCSPGTALPGFKNIKAMHVTSKEAPQSSSALEAMDLDMNGTPAMAPPSECEAGKSLPVEPPVVPSYVAQHMACSLGMVSSESENAESSQLLPLPAAVLPLVDAGTKTVTTKEVCHPLPVTGSTEEANGSILPPALENGCEGPLPHIEPHASSDAAHIAPTSQEITHTSFENSEPSQPTSPCLADTIDPSAHASATMPAILKSDKSSMPLSPLEPTDTDMESATLQQSPLKSEERSLPWPEQHPSSSSAKDATCSPEVAPPGYEKLDSSEQLPLPPPLSMKFELGQMVCGSCCQLLAYPRGAVHVQCFGCCTINLVLEEHQIGKVYCGQCDILLMYPFGAPAVKCSNCLFVTEIGERNVRPRISMEQSVSPHPQDVAHQS